MANRYFLRFKSDDYEGAGILTEGDIHPISGDMFGEYKVEDRTYKVEKIRFLLRKSK